MYSDGTTSDAAGWKSIFDSSAFREALWGSSEPHFHSWLGPSPTLRGHWGHAGTAPAPRTAHNGAKHYSSAQMLATRQFPEKRSLSLRPRRTSIDALWSEVTCVGCVDNLVSMEHHTTSNPLSMSHLIQCDPSREPCESSRAHMAETILSTWSMRSPGNTPRMTIK